MVNAGSLAADRGIEWRETTTPRARDYTNRLSAPSGRRQPERHHHRHHLAAAARGGLRPGHRDRAGAPRGALPLPRHPRPDRPRGHDPRPGQRQHRVDGRLARGGRGGDGGDGGLAGPARGREPDPAIEGFDAAWFVDLDVADAGQRESTASVRATRRLPVTSFATTVTRATASGPAAKRARRCPPRRQGDRQPEGHARFAARVRRTR